jgi:hypothetical protein
MIFLIKSKTVRWDEHAARMRRGSWRGGRKGGGGMHAGFCGKQEINHYEDLDVC